MNFKDRRYEPRILASIPGHIVCHAGKDPVVMTTRNISCSGLYCQVSKFVPLFTRVNIVMNLPLQQGDGVYHEVVDFEGVVVRTEPEREKPDHSEYHVAIFFSGITDKARSLIARYMREHMPTQLGLS